MRFYRRTASVVKKSKLKASQLERENDFISLVKHLSKNVDGSVKGKRKIKGTSTSENNKLYLWLLLFLLAKRIRGENGVQVQIAK
jgi:hypothetical protein